MANLLHVGFAIAAGSLGMCMLVSLPALATENGNTNYPVGVNTVADGNLPPPGMLQLLSYSQYFNSTKLSDGAGNSALRPFGVTVEAEAPRFLYTWDLPVGPFHYTSGLVTPIADIETNILGAHGHATGFGDIDLQNYLGYAAPNHSLFWYFGLDTYLPSGDYDANKLANLGLNYWTFAPNINVSWNPSPRWELAGTLFSEFNTENHATHYRSGNDIDLDYGITYRPLDSVPKFGIGINGLFYKQYANDKINGVAAPIGGNRGQEFAAGPQLRYDFPFGGIVLKYQKSYDVRNRAGGDRIWFEFAIPLFGAPKSDRVIL